MSLDRILKRHRQGYRWNWDNELENRYAIAHGGGNVYSCFTWRDDDAAPVDITTAFGRTSNITVISYDMNCALVMPGS